MMHPIPTGTRDVLPEEKAELRELTDKLMHAFSGFAYREVETPTLEYEEVLVRADERAAGASYRLFDEQGNLLVLRPDMTIPIARMAALRFREAQPPLRFSYLALAYRAVQPRRGQQREFLQAGVELLGEPGPRGDAEAIAVLCAALEAAGLEDFRIGVGNGALYGSLAAGLGAPAGPLLDRLAKRDLVGLGSELGRMDLDAAAVAALSEIPQLRGGPEVLDRARELAGNGRIDAELDQLGELYQLLGSYGVAERAIFDLGLLRELGYYTGAIFEIYAPAIGFTIGGGGRYDRLLGSFGAPGPAVGFAILVERLHIALAEAQAEELEAAPELGEQVLVIGGMDVNIAAARRLRAAGKTVDAVAGGAGDPLALARDRGARHVVAPFDSTALIYRVIDGAPDPDIEAALSP